jgi:hypothetical protein
MLRKKRRRVRTKADGCISKKKGMDKAKLVGEDRKMMRKGADRGGRQMTRMEERCRRNEEGFKSCEEACGEKQRVTAKKRKV